MKKVRLDVEEKLRYRREVEVYIPDDMDDSDLEDALDAAVNRSESLDDFIRLLEREGIRCDGYDDSLDSPSYMEIECDDYDFIVDGEED